MIGCFSAIFNRRLRPVSRWTALIFGALTFLLAILACDAEPTSTSRPSTSTLAPVATPAPTITPVSMPTSAPTITPAPTLTADVRRPSTDTLTRLPTRNVLCRVLWLGHGEPDSPAPVGSGVLVDFGGTQYLVTALHVLEASASNPKIRSGGRWRSIDWKIVAVDNDRDIAVLATNEVLGDQLGPVSYGERTGVKYGSVGYALGFPQIVDRAGSSTDHITVVDGKPIPLVSLVVANFSSEGNATYSASYINAGFSGGAIVFPLDGGQWTLGGIITHFPVVRRPVYPQPEATKLYVLEHTGLVGYIPWSAVENLIESSQPLRQ